MRLTSHSRSHTHLVETLHSMSSPPFYITCGLVPCFYRPLSPHFCHAPRHPAYVTPSHLHTRFRILAISTVHIIFRIPSQVLILICYLVLQSTDPFSLSHLDISPCELTQLRNLQPLSYQASLLMFPRHLVSSICISSL